MQNGQNQWEKALAWEALPTVQLALYFPKKRKKGSSPPTQVANTIDPFDYQLPDLLSRSHCALLVNAEKWAWFLFSFGFFSTRFSEAVQRPLCCGARMAGSHCSVGPRPSACPKALWTPCTAGTDPPTQRE